jgi:hypothetical protein
MFLAFKICHFKSEIIYGTASVYFSIDVAIFPQLFELLGYYFLKDF